MLLYTVAYLAYEAARPDPRSLFIFLQHNNMTQNCYRFLTPGDFIQPDDEFFNPDDNVWSPAQKGDYGGPWAQGDWIVRRKMDTNDVNPAEAWNLWVTASEMIWLLQSMVHGSDIDAAEINIEKWPQRGRSEAVNLKEAMNTAIEYLARARPSWKPLVPKAVDGDPTGMTFEPEGEQP